MQCGFDFIVAPLVDPTRRPSPTPRPAPSSTGTLCPPFLPHQVMHTMASVQISNQIVGRISSWIDCDASDVSTAAASNLALQQELAWAGHLTAQAVILPTPPQGKHCVRYARAINAAIVSTSSPPALWLSLPFAFLPHPLPSSSPSACCFSWEIWNKIRFLCDHSSKLGIVLEISKDTRSTAAATDAAYPGLGRWRGEPVQAILLHTNAFVVNKRGYPTLSKEHQSLVVDAFRYGIQIILTGTPLLSCREQQQQRGDTTTNIDEFPSLVDAITSLATTTNTITNQNNALRLYWEYLSFLFRKQPESNEQDSLETPYRDLLQSPLQPLQDNLESQTYETFERDDTKYVYYQEAIRRALLDRVPPHQAATVVTVVLVVGAGRGPLVSAARKAAAAAGRRLRVYAVEKNPNAIVHIHARAIKEGWNNHANVDEDDVIIVHADMRDWIAPELADIMVSELLGSFGDNELSPECLYGAQRFLKPGAGISIPESYTSFVQPITSHKVWNAVAAYNDLAHFETPFVVKLHRYTALAPPQPVFTFTHPIDLSSSSSSSSSARTGVQEQEGETKNARQAVLRFTIGDARGNSTNSNAEQWCCHGLAGYFDTVLYKDVKLSIHPVTHTPAMSSWFPIFFPVRRPFGGAGGQEVEVGLWRCCSPQKVWYEWCVGDSPIHNPQGRSYWVGL